jgi:DNA-binding NarL/FixJ family response regulator
MITGIDPVTDTVTGSVSVLIVDDQAPFRAAARTVIAVSKGFEVAGEAETGEEAVDLAVAIHPDLVLMDINLPGMDGLEATRWLRSSAHPPVVILLSTYDEDDFGRARDCGAAAYVAKSAFGTERLAAVWASASGA